MCYQSYGVGPVTQYFDTNGQPCSPPPTIEERIVILENTVKEQNQIIKECQKLLQQISKEK